jgi:hypothetical protein
MLLFDTAQRFNLRFGGVAGNADDLKVIESIVSPNEPGGYMIDISCVPGNVGATQVAKAALLLPNDLVLIRS